MVAFILLFLFGIVAGYSLGILEGTGVVRAFRGILPTTSLKEALGPNLEAEAEVRYINPFEVLDAKVIVFPVDQLKSCRNWAECRQFCTQQENFQRCVAWHQSQ
jgi:hypothetical protein